MRETTATAQGTFPGCGGAWRARSDGKGQRRPPPSVLLLFFLLLFAFFSPAPPPLESLWLRGPRGASLMAAFRPSSAAPSEERNRLGGGSGNNNNNSDNQTVLDEFTAPAEKSGFLERSRGCLERLFGVRLAFVEAASSGGGWVPSATGGRRIWLSLLGEREQVRSAKVKPGVGTASSGCLFPEGEPQKEGGENKKML